MSGTRLILGAALVLAGITAVTAQESPFSNEERSAQPLDKPRALQCSQHPGSLVGLHREALRARCGPWQSRSPTGPSQMETLTYRHPDGTLLLRVIADEVVISAVVQDGPISDAERAALEQRQNRLAFERAVAAHRLDKPRALQCRQQPDMLIGLDREALRARCGPWQSRSPTTAVSGNVDELIYRESDGTLLLRVVAGEKVISATER